MLDKSMVDALRFSLQEHIIKVTFKKTNGDIREMLCTLNHDFLPNTPPQDSEVEKKERKAPTTSISVWDMDKHAWRSFRKDSIINFEVQ